MYLKHTRKVRFSNCLRMDIPRDSKAQKVRYLYYINTLKMRW
jgi:hypothetical protein